MTHTHACYECETFPAEPHNTLCSTCADLELVDEEDEVCGHCIDMRNEIQVKR